MIIMKVIAMIISGRRDERYARNKRRRKKKVANKMK
jgi:hypothetical protein